MAAASSQAPRIALLAGELSGDQLGADLMRGIKRRLPDARFEGVGGPAMAAEGLDSLYPLETFSVMGLVEVLRHLPTLLRIRRELAQRFIDDPPDMFVGIDAPDFNLGLAKRLRAAGITTAHYVSPTVWAWRQGRIKGIRRAVDLMLTVLPFEADFYEAHAVPVAFVGHPAADRLEPGRDPRPWRERLGLDPERPVLAVLPGSRGSELEKLGAAFARSVKRLRRDHPRLQFIAPMATPRVRGLFEAHLADAGLAGVVRLLDGESEAAMSAADVVLLACGTAALEAMLLGRPMVVAYKVSGLTYGLVKGLGLMKIRHYAMPNVLAGRELAPEYIQSAVSAENLSGAVDELLREPAARARQVEGYAHLHEQLCRSAGDRAAEALIACLNKHHS
ncbi:lipid-A-disaccharide synthase [Alkalilimnicola sp. S0819]|uniref:lipid-A-disaccharide synthase n=1 Tax=Alkalilimnicola sp. S0819 TaxID=2613922 RepID=UPI0012616CC6|nr:lipid-A-disaccharide synthase [Alkalilimnicola sp. S0819]KAB7627928.1 lipid-A-disaccharide synthase [Alkalilimnicola sp. S0819]MPQ15565.1 lipid-A-disaccharide synthase [Alkalilimnicola sp. S0819]